MGALTSKAGPAGYRVGLRFHDLTLLLFKDEALHSKYPLTDKTLAQAYDWLETTLAKATGRAVTLKRPDYALPHHPVAAGAPFSGTEPYKEVANWYGNAATLLEEVRVAHSGASPVRCWPHHFDIATRLEPEKGGVYSIGAGMMPGDSEIPEPYWYVTPWPVPDRAALPTLASGRWHTEGWTGAVLPASSMTRGSADAQALEAEAFFRSAVAALLSLTAPG